MEVYRMVMPWDERKATSTQLDKKRIAILPFANMSPDPNDGYSADGMTEELISTTSSVGRSVSSLLVANGAGGGLQEK